MLFHMCKLAQKPVFTAGAGMAQIVSYCAALKVHKLEVVNGNEKGGRLQDIHNILDGDAEKLKMLDPRKHAFLDNLSGDYYSYDHSQKSWIPAGNFGLHFSRAEASLYGETIGGASDMLKPVQKYQNPEDLQKKPLI